ncbi:hypothetical protein RHMOL_Rhmol01G0011100 [Rhododendron molle]|uniref:Uncharacterized protein n=1 Tax=Rhododendron molle TaxID=49168 RepID=A0ACC0PYQ9_RHOML|nr:hypothetical protein RHMOL_Rhmol01G0011100 [Rhododendron molle]
MEKNKQMIANQQENEKKKNIAIIIHQHRSPTPVIPIMHKSFAPIAAHLNRTTTDESSANGEYDGGGPAVEELERLRRREA